MGVGVHAGVGVGVWCECLHVVVSAGASGWLGVGVSV